MSKNIEYEKRVMLTKTQYDELYKYAQAFSYKKEYLLINHYFDDPHLSLIKSHHVLRIREINDSEYELTLKVKGDKGDLEINKLLNKEEKDELLNHFILKDEDIKKHLFNINIDNLKLITSLKTERIEIPFDNFLFVLDKNYYSDVIDYDLEIESSDIETALNIIQKYCNQFGMQYHEDYLSKSRRAINKVINN